MMRLGISILTLWLCTQQMFAQQRFTTSGYAKDAKTGESLIGVIISVKEASGKGSITNGYGFYSLTLPQGKYTFIANILGYKPDSLLVDLTQNQTIDFELGEANTQLGEVVVESVKRNQNVTQAQTGVEKMNMKEVEKVPVIFGEKDIMKTIQLLPGIKAAGEGSSGFNVRGGATDQNAIMLDEAPVYNASHLMGFFSTFNGDAVKDVTVYKGNYPAQYGGRISSVLDVKMNEGNNKEYHVSGGIGLISSRLSVEGPIQKNKSSFLITGRRTYADAFLLLSKNMQDASLYFYDLNMKANYQINNKNQLFLSGYFGRDNLGINDKFNIDWGNKTGTLRWNSVLSPKVFSNTSLIYSNYGYNIKVQPNGTTFKINSKIEDWNLKQEFQYFTTSNSSWKFGVNEIRHTITPSRFTGSSTVNTDTKGSKYSLESAVYATNSYSFDNVVNLEYGLRVSAFSLMGSSRYNIYNNGTLTDSVSLGSGSFGKTYLNLEPRFSASFVLNSENSIKAAYSRNTQNLHLLSNSTSTNPTDQWIGSSYNIKPEISDQFSLGYFHNFMDNKLEFSLESYYKNMQNQIDYKNGADINTSSDVESQLLFGKGRAYGLEFLLKKKTGKFTGWVSYTLSRTERKIDGINNNNWYNAKQDRTHDIAIVGVYQLNDKWNLSSSWVYYTGNAVTFPSGKYNIDGKTIFLYTERNGYRMPAYHRLDLSATYEVNHSGRYTSSWCFGIYNAYGRQNAYSITFEDDPNDATRTRAIQTSLFRWVPSVTYNFKF